MKDPVVAKDGHTYEKEVIKEWIRKKSVSPFTKEILHIEELMPNLAIKKREVFDLSYQLRQLEGKLQLLKLS